MRAWLLAVLMTTVTLAGCASVGPSDSTDSTVAEPVLEDALAAIRAGSTSVNLDVLGTWEQTGEEAASWEDYVFLDAGSKIQILQRVGNGSFELSLVSEIMGVGPKDVKVSDDGQWLFIGNDEQGSNTPAAETGRVGGFYTYFIGDKANPELTHFLPVGPTRGPHMVAYLRQADGRELVFGANGDITINQFDRDSGTLRELARYAPNYVTDVDRDPYRLDAYYQTYAHDMFAMNDPVTNASMLYVANWDAGLRILDISDPAAPVELGSWNDFGDGESGNLHTVATEWIGDRRITVGSPEIGFAVVGGLGYATDSEPPVIYIWDTTDPANVVLLGMWQNPMDAKTGRQDLGETLNSPHNVQLEGGLLYVAHYDLGIFVLDLRTPDMQAAPQVLAYHQEGHTWDVIISQGQVIGSGSYGLLGLGFPLLEQGPEGLFSRA